MKKQVVTTCFLERCKIPIIFLWVVLLFEPVIVSYLESRDQDPFVTGNTERRRVVNKFLLPSCCNTKETSMIMMGERLEKNKPFRPCFIYYSPIRYEILFR